MFYLSNYQIVTSLMRQGLRGVPSLTNRKMGFGGPSPHRVFQHHQPNVANVEARSVVECRRMPLVLRHEITRYTMKKHERLGIVWACGIMLKCLDSVGFYVLRSN